MKCKFLNFFKIFLFFFFVFLGACNVPKEEENEYSKKIGIDPFFEKENFGKQTSNVNGYISDLLLQVSLNENVDLEKIDANWGALFEHLDEKKLDGIISSSKEYIFNEKNIIFLTFY